MAIVIAVLQGKGGTGKTTVSINIAGALRQAGYRVAVADMDPQQSALAWAHNGTELVDLVHPLIVDNARAAFAEIAVDQDYVVIDTPPTLTTKEPLIAAALAHLLVIPCLAGIQEYQRADQTLAAVDVFNTPFRLLGSQIDTRETIGREAQATLRSRGPTFETVLSKAVAMRECVFSGQWIGSYAPDSRSHRECRALVDEIIETMETGHGEV